MDQGINTPYAATTATTTTTTTTTSSSTSSGSMDYWGTKTA
jgi:hypothetical protein